MANSKFKISTKGWIIIAVIIALIVVGYIMYMKHLKKKVKAFFEDKRKWQAKWMKTLFRSLNPNLPESERVKAQKAIDSWNFTDWHYKEAMKVIKRMSELGVDTSQFIISDTGDVREDVNFQEFPFDSDFFTQALSDFSIGSAYWSVWNKYGYGDKKIKEITGVFKSTN